MEPGRKRGLLAVLVAGPLALGWLLYAAFIGVISLEGENCSDADRATCTEADPAYGIAQVVAAAVGLGLTARALAARTRSTALPAAAAFVVWAVLVGVRIAVAGHPW